MEKIIERDLLNKHDGERFNLVKEKRVNFNHTIFGLYRIKDNMDYWFTSQSEAHNYLKKGKKKTKEEINIDEYKSVLEVQRFN